MTLGAYSTAALLMPVRSLLFRAETARWRGPFRGDWPRAPAPSRGTKVSNYQMDLDAPQPCDLMTRPKNRFRKAEPEQDESSWPRIDASQDEQPRQKVKLVPLGATRGASAYLFFKIKTA